MPTTATLLLPYPAPADPADVPLDMQELADRIETVRGAVNGLASLDAGGKVPAAQLPSAASAELAYAQITATVTVTATTAATAQTVVASSSVTYDGTAVLVDFFAYLANPAAVAGAAIVFNLYDGSTDLGRIGHLATPAAATLGAPVRLGRRLTPTAAAHTYSVRAWVTTGTGFVQAGAGGTDTGSPAFIRITRA